MNPWKLAVPVLVVLFAALVVFKSCELLPPIEIPDYEGRRVADSLRYATDSAFWHRRHIADSAHSDSTAKVAESWRKRSLASRPTRPPRVGTIPPDSGSQVNGATYLTLSAQNDSLWTALDLADSAYAFLNDAYQAQRRATADAKAGWAAADSALVRERNTAEKAIADLTARLKKAQRGNGGNRVGLGADLSVVPDAATLVAGAQFTTRKKVLWIAEVEASAIAGLGVGATPNGVKTGPGGSLRLNLTF